MSRFQRVGFNPLPWFFTSAGFDRSAAPPLADIYRQIREAGFGAVHAEVPAEMSIQEYRRLLADSELEPAPGYFQASFSDSAALACLPGSLYRPGGSIPIRVVCRPSSTTSARWRAR